ncbi:PDZ domain-containing protein [Flavihumibacter fluvii]|uniref:PDZ domain-containing protein n=1 Tax=Flavihumibacter fluvii TaxID=2838157 RepID=UPI001BDEFF91|nr:PDZ domain-containing protein [Flavihumibacter fluvii]ULQ51219.1 PDZ domain-containing protein [Flavihumibacter fluvii]
MKKHMKILTPSAVCLGFLVLMTNLAFSQDKKKSPDKLDDSEQIIIKWKSNIDADTKGEKGSKGPKGQKDVKLVIELKDDAVLVNGKPLDEFNDEELAVLKKDIIVMDGNTFSLAVPGHPRSAFRGGSWTMENDGPVVLGYGNPNSAFLGVGSEKTDKGVVITEITDGSAAAKAGLKEGDIITKIDATAITSPDQLSSTIGKYKPDSKIIITIKRAGKEQKVNATLGKRMPRISTTAPGFNLNEDFEFKSFEWMDNRPKLGIKAQDTEDGKGVKVLDVDEESAAEKAGLKEGDIITSFDGTAINSVNQLVDVSRAAKDAKKVVLPLKFLRDNKEQQVDLKLPRKLRTAEL